MNKERYESVRITPKLFRRGIHVNHIYLYAKEIHYKYKYYNRRLSSLTRPNLINQCFQTKCKNEI